MLVFQRPNLDAWTSIGNQVFTVTVRNSDGTAYDLTGLDVTISAAVGGAYMIESLACTLSATPTDGTITFTPSAGEVAIAGVYECQLRIDNGGAIAMPFPFTMTVRDPIYSAGA